MAASQEGIAVIGTTLAYIRVSTEGQEVAGNGLPVQHDAIATYATFYALKIAAWYQDVESGAKEHREGLDAVREAVRAGGVSTLLVYRLDRIARDVIISETVYRELTAAGCRIISVSEAIDDSPAGHLMRVILSGFAQYERSIIALRTTAGRRARVATAGTFAGGTAPFGYRTVGKRGVPGGGLLAVDEAQAAIVRLVFALDAEGNTLQGIAARLNGEGYQTAEGAAFSHVQVRRILKRHALYRGEGGANVSIPLAPGVIAPHQAIIDCE